MFQFKIKESNVRLHEFAVLLVSVLQIRHNSEYGVKYAAKHLSIPLFRKSPRTILGMFVFVSNHVKH